MVALRDPDPIVNRRPDPDTSVAPDNARANAASPVDALDQVEDQIRRWAADPSALADDDFEAPSLEILGIGFRLVALARENSRNIPELRFTRVSPDGEGGLSFEATVGSTSVVFELSPDVGVRMLKFSDGVLIHKQLFQ